MDDSLDCFATHRAFGDESFGGMRACHHSPLTCSIFIDSPRQSREMNSSRSS